jgi:methyltransferase-like protein/2-polyprenyl-3-methyl-5-hydroxy-6-metoxy-1,4-benzoquinol methylase
MSEAIPTAYDEVLYSSYAFSQTHPDRLATLATLFGMQPAAVTNCRVLELGCGDGSNLIPMAFGLPRSEFLGIDLALRPLEHGQKIVETLGLKNIILRQLDVMEVSPDFGQFNYIIAHGLYSWVPPAVQDKILAICQANLAPNGIAYVSYNTYPGGHIRQMVREMMRFHTRRLSDPTQRIAQARALLRFLTEAQPESEAYGAFLQEELKRVTAHKDGYLYHDDLAEINTPVYFYQFVERAAQHGLQYLAEADFFEMQDHMFPAQMAETLRQMASRQVILKEQYADFLKCRKFRQTLLCHHNVQLDRTLPPERLTSFYIASSAQPIATYPDIHSSAIEEFRSIKGQTLATNHPLVKAAMLCLGDIWPRSLRFDELLAQARTRLGLKPRDREMRSVQEALILGDVLLQAYGKNLVELHVHAPEFVTEVSDRPVASPLARLQIQHDAMVTNLCHGCVRVDDMLGKQLLLLLDGTRDRTALCNELLALVQSGAVTVRREGQPITDPCAQQQLLTEGLEQKLAELAQLALLVG